MEDEVYLINLVKAYLCMLIIIIFQTEKEK